MSLDGVNFDARFAKYEQYVKQASTEGRINLKGEAIGEQLGRYATGLQNAETKKQNKQFGKEYGKALAQEREKAKFQRLYGKKPASTWQKYQAEHGLPVKPVEVSGVVKADREAEKIIAQNQEKQALKDKLATRKAEIRERLANDYNRNEVSGVVKADREAEKIIAQNKKAAAEISKSANKSGFLSKIAKTAKGKGKCGLVAAGVTLLGLGLYSLFKSGKKEETKSVELRPETSTKPVAVTEKQQKEKPQAPAKEDTPVEETPETSVEQETPVAETPQAPIKPEVPADKLPGTPVAPVKPEPATVTPIEVESDKPEVPADKLPGTPVAPVKPEPATVTPIGVESDKPEVAIIDEAKDPNNKAKNKELKKQQKEERKAERLQNKQNKKLQKQEIREMKRRAKAERRAIRKQAKQERREIRKQAKQEIREIKQRTKQEIAEYKQSLAA